jgi:hypothetical protein
VLCRNRDWLLRIEVGLIGRLPCRALERPPAGATGLISTASMQKLTSMVIESRQAKTLRLNQSTTAVR